MNRGDYHMKIQQEHSRTDRVCLTLEPGADGLSKARFPIDLQSQAEGPQVMGIAAGRGARLF